MLPIFLRVISHFPDYQFVLAAAPGISLQWYQSFIKNNDLKKVKLIQTKHMEMNPFKPYLQIIGTPIKAMADGIVTLAKKDLYYTGATLIFDHGHGISTLYMHMDKIFVEKDDIVKQGDIIGTVGSSGRSTGPHLDIRLNWFNVKLDPATVLEMNR